MVMIISIAIISKYSVSCNQASCWLAGLEVDLFIGKSDFLMDKILFSVSYPKQESVWSSNFEQTFFREKTEPDNLHCLVPCDEL